MPSDSQTKFQELLEIEKGLETESKLITTFTKEYTSSSPQEWSSLLKSMGNIVYEKVVQVKDKFKEIAEAPSFIQKNYISIIVLVVTLFLVNYSFMIFFVFINLKIIISTFLSLIRFLFNYAFDFGTTIEFVIYDQLVSIIIKRMTHDCCINSTQDSRKEDGSNIVSKLKSLSMHMRKNNGSVDTMCSAIFALTKPFSSIMTTVQNKYDTIYVSLLSILYRVVSYFTSNKQEVIDMSKFENSNESNGIVADETQEKINMKELESSSEFQGTLPPVILRDRQQFYPEIRIRRQLYVQNCVSNSKMFTAKFFEQTILIIAALSVIVLVPGVSYVIGTATFLSKMFFISNLLSLLQNGKVLAYIGALQVFVALYLCCLYKKQPTVANTKLITRKFVKNKILRCSASTSKQKGLVERLMPLLHLKSTVFRNVVKYLPRVSKTLSDGHKNVTKVLKEGNIFQNIIHMFKFILNVIKKACNKKSIMNIYFLLKELTSSNAGKVSAIVGILTRQVVELIQDIVIYLISEFPRSRRQSAQQEEEGRCKETEEYKNSILGCVLFSYYERYKKSFMDESSSEAVDFSTYLKSTLDEIQQSFYLYDESDSELKVDTTIAREETLLYDEVEKEISLAKGEVIDQFCVYLQLTYLTYDKLDETLRLKMKSLEYFLDNVLSKKSVELFKQEIHIQSPTEDAFFEKAENLLSRWDDMENMSKNTFVRKMQQLLYNENVSLEGKGQGKGEGEGEFEETSVVSSVRLIRQRIWSCEAFKNVVYSIVDIFKETNEKKFSDPSPVVLMNTHPVKFLNGQYYVNLKFYYDNGTFSVVFSCDFSKVFHSKTNEVATDIVIVETNPIQNLKLLTKQQSLISTFFRPKEINVVSDNNDILLTVQTYKGEGIDFTKFGELSSESLPNQFIDFGDKSFKISLATIANPPSYGTSSDKVMLFFDESKLVNFFFVDRSTRYGLYHNDSLFGGTVSYLFHLNEKQFSKFSEDLDKIVDKSGSGTDIYRLFQGVIATVPDFKKNSSSGGRCHQSKKRPSKKLVSIIIPKTSSFPSKKRGKHFSSLPIP
jgi:ABC-type multidrug transport system fused ATPase/permease subunit